MNVVPYHSWIVTANATNATATATKAAPAAGGVAHYVTSISGSFNMAAAGKSLILKQGTTELGRWYVHNQLVLSFSSPIKLDPATAANLELEAGGVAVIGAATMTGFTL